MVAPVGEYANTVGAAANFPVETLIGVIRPDLLPNVPGGS